MSQRLNFEFIETSLYATSLSEVSHKGLNKSNLNESIKAYICEQPLEGAIIPGTPGVRKLRYAMPGKGKRGSFRVIYYFFDYDRPVYLLDIYAKNTAEDLSPKGKIALANLVKELKRIYK